MLDKMPGIKLMNVQGGGGDEGRWFSLLRWFICFIYTGLLTAVSLVPSSSLDNVPRFMEHEDKLGHFVAYALLLCVFWWAMRLRGTGAVKKLFFIAVLCAVYGLFLEFMQGVVQPGDRQKSLWDAVFNLGGALSAAFVLRIFTRDRSVGEVFLRQSNDD